MSAAEIARVLGEVPVVGIQALALPTEARNVLICTDHEAVRQLNERGLGTLPPEALASPLTHPSNQLLIQINPNWRIVEDDLQYILQRRKGSARKKSKGWTARSFYRTREALLLGIREYCGSVDEDALKPVRALPEWHINSSCP
jgi:hypothetical protein